MDRRLYQHELSVELEFAGDTTAPEIQLLLDVGNVRRLYFLPLARSTKPDAPEMQSMRILA